MLLYLLFLYFKILFPSAKGRRGLGCQPKAWLATWQSSCARNTGDRQMNTRYNNIYSLQLLHKNITTILIPSCPQSRSYSRGISWMSREIQTWCHQCLQKDGSNACLLCKYRINTSQIIIQQRKDEISTVWNLTLTHTTKHNEVSW